MRESEFSLTFELLISNVRDAIIDWDGGDLAFEEIVDGLVSGRLSKEDYEVRYHYEAKPMLTQNDMDAVKYKFPIFPPYY